MSINITFFLFQFLALTLTDPVVLDLLSQTEGKIYQIKTVINSQFKKQS